jgi:hypothetical protein
VRNVSELGDKKIMAAISLYERVLILSLLLISGEFDRGLTMVIDILVTLLAIHPNS